MEQIETQVSDLRFLTQTPAERRISGPSPFDILPGIAAASPLSATSATDSMHYRHPSLQPSTPNAASLLGGGPGAGVGPGPPSGGGGLGGARPPAAFDESGEGSGGSNKRKASEEQNAQGPGKAQRSKRNRYISIACNECKRRKIKCNGETPCQRCGNLNLQCLYAPNCCSNNWKDSDEFKAMTAQVAKLQDQVETLFQSINALRNETLQPRMPPPAHQHQQQQQQHQQHQQQQDRTTILSVVSPPGPSTVSPSPVMSHGSAYRPEMTQPKPAFRANTNATSTSFGLEPTNNSIHGAAYKGISPMNESSPGSATAGPSPDDHTPRHAPHSAQDPLWDLTLDEMLRLCRVYEDEVSIVHPAVNIQAVTSHAKSLASFMESSRRNGMLPSFNDERTILLKIVMCCALTVEEQGSSERARRLYESVEPEIGRKMVAGEASVAGLRVLMMVAGYRFLCNDEVLAWRVAGQVARLCLELGIHRRRGLMAVENEQERQEAVVSFWYAYVFDRRWSFENGLPWVIQDADIDPKLPLPDEHPYLMAMISYSRLGAKVFKLTSQLDSPRARDDFPEDAEDLDREIIQWYEKIPDEVKIRDLGKDKRMSLTPSYNLQRLRIWTYLRVNQLRIWLYTPFLHNASSINRNPAGAQRAMQLANETVRYLANLSSTSPLYHRMQVLYHQFLGPAIEAVFLASAHSPSRLAPLCREEFYMALELVKDMSARSWVSKRLWRAFSSLKEAAPQIGAEQRQEEYRQQQQQQHQQQQQQEQQYRGEEADSVSGRRGSTVGRSPYPRPMLRSAPMDTRAGSGQVSAEGPVMQSANGVQLQTEMRRVFEAYVGAVGGDTLPRLDILGGFTNADALYTHFRNVF